MAASKSSCLWSLLEFCCWLCWYQWNLTCICCNLSFNLIYSISFCLWIYAFFSLMLKRQLSGIFDLKTIDFVIKVASHYWELVFACVLCTYDRLGTLKCCFYLGKNHLPKWLEYFFCLNLSSEIFTEDSFNEWVELAEAPALPASLKLYNELKQLGVKIFLLTGRDEHQRNATVKNLLSSGYTGWEKLILRYEMDTDCSL